jgi:tryptophan synthase alpha chain
MSGRIAAIFDALRAARRTGLITYITAGDPDLERTREILVALDRGGADVLEVGVPFSDPLADGPVIQRASERALRSGTTLVRTLDAVRAVRPALRAPVVIFTYANPIVRLGYAAFARAAADAGVDGVLALDLPLEEAEPLRAALADAAVDPIFLLSPTTTDERIAVAARLGRGFLYVISRMGVTGARDAVAAGARDLVGRVRAVTPMPVALGFGLSRPEHVREVGAYADAAVVGSALVNVIAHESSGPDLAGRVEQYVRWLTGNGPGPREATA